MRVAFFGGSFDPPHLGHLKIALAAADRMRLDRVLLAPVALQPLKRGPGAQPASFADRLAMLRVLVDEAGDGRLAVSELDAARTDGRPNYTFDTLERLRAELALRDELFLLTGADALETLPQWHRAWELVASVGVIVATRPGFVLADLYPSLLQLLEPVSGTLRAAEGSTAEVEHWVLEQANAAAHFYFLTGLHEDVSATAIRSALRVENEPAGLAPGVLAYIREHRLYR